MFRKILKDIYMPSHDGLNFGPDKKDNLTLLLALYKNI